MAARQRLLASAVGSQTSQYNNTATTANQSQSSSNQVHQSSSSITNLQASNQLIQPPYNNTGPVHKPKKPPIKHSQPSIIKNSTSDPTNSRGQFSSTPILHQQVYGGSTTNLVHSGYQGGSVSNLQHSGYHGGSTGRITRWAAADNTYTQSAPAHRVAHGVNNPGLRVNLQVSDVLLYCCLVVLGTNTSLVTRPKNQNLWPRDKAKLILFLVWLNQCTKDYRFPY